MTAAPDYDVAVVGYGPTGELLSILLGQMGYRVGVFERWPEVYALPRAVHFDDEVGRIFQAAGLRSEVLAITDPVPDFYEWRNREGQALLKIDWARPGSQGWPRANFFTQPELQRVLDRRARSIPTVEVHAGWEVSSVKDHGDRVVIEAQRGEAGRAGEWIGSDEVRRFSAGYLIGADGANSAIREIIGSEFHDLGFLPFDWLICDVIPHDQERVWSPMNWQLCDPMRPTTIVSGGPGRRRWEFMRLPGEQIDDLNTAGTAWRLLERWGMTPETARLERHAVYRFMARYAQRWRAGRLLLAGDAAHLMPPFAGQGMCNGMRDAMNLAWKLDLVLRGKVSEEILDSYQQERLDHVRRWIEFSAALGEVICVLDEDQAAARDARMLAGEADPARVLPAAPPQRLGAGLFAPEQAVAGTHFIQASVASGDQRGLFDEVVGRGFCLIGASEDPLLSLGEGQRALLEAIGAHAVWVSGDAQPVGERAVADLDGAYRAWFEANHCEAVLVRPDFYVFGTAPAARDVSALVEELRRSLALEQSPALPAPPGSTVKE
jgi:2-polyprenyl-6-methoxyphenol hydroxylase-like FAD-dependent oxidoreductase